MGLKPKQILFVKEYLVDKNATRAAMAAGYSKKTAHSMGSENLRKPEIARAIADGFEAQTKNAEARAAERGITKERWLKKLEIIAFANMDQFATVTTDHVNLTPTSQRKKYLGHAIKKVSETQTQYGGSTGIELHNPLQALELIGKHYGWVKEKFEHSGVDGGPMVTVNVSLPANGRELSAQGKNKK